MSPFSLSSVTVPLASGDDPEESFFLCCNSVIEELYFFSRREYIGLPGWTVTQCDNSHPLRSMIASSGGSPVGVPTPHLAEDVLNHTWEEIHVITVGSKLFAETQLHLEVHTHYKVTEIIKTITIQLSEFSRGEHTVIST